MPSSIFFFYILLTVHLSIIYFSLFPTWYTVFRLRTISAILFPLHVSGLTGPSSGGLNCTCSLWYSPPLQTSLSCGRWVLSQRPHDKDVCRGGEYHRLHVQFRPPDDGPVRPETCRGKRIADIVCRQKTVYQVRNKEKKNVFLCTNEIGDRHSSFVEILRQPDMWFFVGRLLTFTRHCVPSPCALGSTQPLKMSTRIFLGVKTAGA